MKDGVEYTLRFGRAAGVGQKKNRTRQRTKTSRKAPTARTNPTMPSPRTTREPSSTGTSWCRHSLIPIWYPSRIFNPCPRAVPQTKVPAKTQKKPPTQTMAKTVTRRHRTTLPTQRTAKSGNRRPAIRRMPANKRQSPHQAQQKSPPNQKRKTAKLLRFPRAKLHFVVLQDDAGESIKVNGQGTAKSNQTNSEATAETAKSSAVKRPPMASQIPNPRRPVRLLANKPPVRLIRQSPKTPKRAPMEPKKTGSKSTEGKSSDSTKVNGQSGEKKLSPEQQEDLARTETHRKRE